MYAEYPSPLRADYAQAFAKVPLGHLIEMFCAQSRTDLDEPISQAVYNANSAHRETNTQGLVSFPISYQDAEFVPQAYAEADRERQRPGTPPFSICASINGPEGGDFSDAIEAVETAQREYPDLPQAHFTRIYKPDVGIAEVKRDVNNVHLSVRRLRAGLRGSLPRNLFMVSEDIDLFRWSPGFMSRLPNALRNGVVFAQAGRRHARSNGRFPNMDSVMFAYDLAVSANPRAMHDTHNAVLARAYVLTGGLALCDEVEGIRFQGRLRELYGSRALVRVPGTFSASSPRRPYWAMQHKVSPAEMWDGSYPKQTEAYRTAEFQDISPDMAREMIANLGMESNFFGPRRSLLDAARERMVWNTINAQTRGYGADQGDREKLAREIANEKIDRIQRAARFVLLPPGAQ
jgi:hypothetical protein